MDLENQKRVKDFAEQYGAENIVVVLGAAEGEAAGLAAETVTAGDPISMMEMVMDVDDIAKEMSSIREQYCKYL